MSKKFTQSVNFQSENTASLLEQHEMRVKFLEAEEQKLDHSIAPIARLSGMVKIVLEPLVRIECQNNNGLENKCNKTFHNQQEFEVHIKRAYCTNCNRCLTNLKAHKPISIQETCSQCNTVIGKNGNLQSHNKRCVLRLALRDPLPNEDNRCNIVEMTSEERLHL